MRPILLVLLLAAAPAWAEGYQGVDSIRAAALSTVEPGAEAEVTLDAGLRMPACPERLQAQPNGNTVEVACPGGWRLFVPMRVRRSQDVLVLNRGLAAGETVDLADISIERRDASRIAGAALANPADAVGRNARRVLPAGALLSASDLVSPRLVHRGDNVDLVSRAGGLEVRMRGRALADAGAGDRVSVESASSRKVIQGTVDASGAVVVAQ